MAAQDTEENWSGTECLSTPFNSLLFVYVSDSMDLSKISVSMLLCKSVGYRKITNYLAKAAKY